MRGIKILLSCCLIIVLCGCALEKEPTETNDTIGSAMSDIVETEPIATAVTTDHYDVYEIDSADSIFNHAVGNNEIDKRYQQEIQQAITTDEMVQVELKYITIWQEELEKSVARFESILSDEDADLLNQIQTGFHTFDETRFKLDSGILLQKKYNVQIGTASYWLLYCEKRDAIRDHTLHIKYMHYLVERSNGAENQVYLSLQFG